MSSLFGNNNQTQNQQGGGGLFGNLNNNNQSSPFGNISKPNQGQGLFAGNLNNNNNQPNLFGNKPNNNNPPSNTGGLFDNNQPNTSGGFFGNINNTTNTTSTNNQNPLFGAQGNNNTNAGTSPFSGNFQNNNQTTNTNPPSNNLNLNTPLFGAQNTNNQNTTNVDLTKNKSDNNFSLFNNNNKQTVEKPIINNTNQTQTNPQNSLFSGGQTGNSLFGAPKPEENKPKEAPSLFNNNIQTQTQNQNKENKEKKAEDKPANSLFGNNINTNTNNNQPGTGNSNSLFSNIPNNKPEQKQADNNNNNNQGLNLNLNLPNNNNIILNPNAPNQNQPKSENNKNEMNNINNNMNNNINNNMNIKIPEKPFDVSLSNAKELEEFEKNQMLYKTNSEILNEFKKMLYNQKAKYKQCVQNTRKFERKLIGLIEITETNAIIAKTNEKKGQKIIDKINTIDYLSKNLENIITNFNDRLNENLIPFRDNIMHSDKFLLNENNSEKFKFYENFEHISDKCYLIENAVNEAEQNFFKKEKEIGDKNKDNNDGIWIEKNNKKIFINQNEMNNLFSECYDGLANLKNMQDNIDKQYEILKAKLLKSNKNNYNINYNMNNIY